MAKIKFTKGELKRQRDGLKQFRRYLPTLQLKKQQLQSKVLEARRHLDDCRQKYRGKYAQIKAWNQLLGDAQFDLKKWLAPKDVITESLNVAGANVPVFKDVVFPDADYDFYTTPFWLDRALAELRELVHWQVQVEIAKLAIRVLEKELRTTTQRVNLFEKVKIPECLDNIRKIRIYLGDQMANAVGIGKVAKKKVEEKALEAAFA
jgi:V/A-type H+-transporting ATPase subunit D